MLVAFRSAAHKATAFPSKDTGNKLTLLGDHIRKRGANLRLCQQHVAEQIGVDIGVLLRWHSNKSPLLGVWHTMSQQYDALSRITSETFPDSEQITYTYNEAGWLSTVSGYINGITYDAPGTEDGADLCQ